MITIPEEFTLVQGEQYIPISFLQNEYRKWYSKQIPDNATIIIDNISEIADFRRGSDKESRYNSIIFIKVCLRALPSVQESKEIFREIAKGIFRAVPYQCFIIFQYQKQVKYCVSIFRPYINNQRNNAVEELVVSNWIKDSDNQRRNIETERRINELLKSPDNANGIYHQIYQIIKDNYSYEMQKYESSYERLIRNVNDETVSGEPDAPDSIEDIAENYIRQMEEPLPTKYEVEDKKYRDFKEKAENDKTGKFQYDFAKINNSGQRHRNLRIYIDYLQKAANNEYPKAVIELADCYYETFRDETGSIIIPKDKDKAHELYMKIYNKINEIEITELEKKKIKDRIWQKVEETHGINH